jgi:mitogen-activated protein kinase 1/3
MIIDVLGYPLSPKELEMFSEYSDEELFMNIEKSKGMDFE